MCAGNFPYYYDPSMWKAKKVTRIRFAKIHKFATNRWLNVKKAEAARFWKSVMDLCVYVETEFELRNIEERKDA